MPANATSMVLGSFVGDALALGTHWVYNTNVIDRKVGRIDGIMAPIVKSWHPNRDKGAFTHYGDLAMVLLADTADPEGFDLSRFAGKWQNTFTSYDGYLDKATKVSLENMKNGAEPKTAGSDSTDFSGASRIAPLVYRYHRDVDTLVKLVRGQTAMTHNTPRVIDSAEILARTTVAVLGGRSPVKALEQTIGSHFNHKPYNEWLADGLDAKGLDTRKVIKDFGQTCNAEDAFLSFVHLIATYETDFKTAMIENCMAGGDSAARGLALGMILGANLGMEAIPDTWLNDMTSRNNILQYLDEIDRQRA